MKFVRIIIWVQFCILISLQQTLCQNASFERHLLSDLFDTYSNAVRPRPLPPGSTHVKFAMGFVQILDVDEKHEVLKSIIWFRLEWEDRRLKWNPLHYGHVDEIHVPADIIWKPDLLLYNTYSISDGFRFTDPAESDDQHFYATVNSNGIVKLHFPSIVESMCKMNIAEYPFDSQVCTLEFVSWSLDANAVRLTRLEGGNDLVPYVAHKSWTLEEITNEEDFIRCAFDATRYCSKITYSIPITRTSTFEVINYTLPPVIVAILSFLVFLVPPEVGKRMECGITLILCLAVYLGVVNKKMPSTSEEFPLITKFYACVIVEITVAMILSCFCLHIYDPEGISLFEHSKYLRTLTFGYMARLIRHPYRKNPNKIGTMDDPDNSAVSRILRRLPEIIHQATHADEPVIAEKPTKKKRRKDDKHEKRKRKKRSKHHKSKAERENNNTESTVMKTEDAPEEENIENATENETLENAKESHPNDEQASVAESHATTTPSLGGETNDGRPDSGFAEHEYNDDKGSCSSASVGTEASKAGSKKSPSGVDLNFIVNLPGSPADDEDGEEEDKVPLNLPTKPQKSADLTYRVKKPQPRKSLEGAPYMENSPVKQRQMKRQGSRSEKSLRSLLDKKNNDAETSFGVRTDATLKEPFQERSRKPSPSHSLFRSIILRHMAPGPSVAMANMIERENKKLSFKTDWMMQAMILNRFFLIGLIIAVFCSMLAVFLQSSRLRFDN